MYSIFTENRGQYLSITAKIQSLKVWWKNTSLVLIVGYLLTVFLHHIIITAIIIIIIMIIYDKLFKMNIIFVDIKSHITTDIIFYIMPIKSLKKMMNVKVFVFQFSLKRLHFTLGPVYSVKTLAYGQSPLLNTMPCFKHCGTNRDYHSCDSGY